MRMWRNSVYAPVSETGGRGHEGSTPSIRTYALVAQRRRAAGFDPARRGSTPLEGLAPWPSGEVRACKARRRRFDSARCSASTASSSPRSEQGTRARSSERRATARIRSSGCRMIPCTCRSSGRPRWRPASDRCETTQSSPCVSITCSRRSVPTRAELVFEVAHADEEAAPSAARTSGLTIVASPTPARRQARARAGLPARRRSAHRHASDSRSRPSLAASARTATSCCPSTKTMLDVSEMR